MWMLMWMLVSRRGHSESAEVTVQYSRIGRYSFLQVGGILSGGICTLARSRAGLRGIVRKEDAAAHAQLHHDGGSAAWLLAEVKAALHYG